MAVEFFTGFEGCGDTGDVLSKFTTTSSVAYSATGGYANGKCLSFSSDSTSHVINDVTAGKTKVIGFHVVGLGTYTGYTGTLSYSLVKFVAGANVIWVVNTASGVRVYRGSTLISSSATVIASDLTHVAIKVFSDASAGTIELRLNGEATGIVFDNPTGLNTGGSDITSVGIGPNKTNSVKIDNVFFGDDFHGEVYSVLCNPSADSSVQFTPSAGSNYACIDEDAQNGDTDYVESSTVGHKDLYAFEDVATSGVVIQVVALTTVARKDDAGGRTLTPIAKQDSTEYDQTTVTLATAYPAVNNTASTNVFSAAPDAQAWTPTIFNAMTWGFKVEA